MKTQHTPGPWHVNTLEVVPHTIHAARGHVALVSVGTMREVPSDEIEANARLIAAAPDLLWALQSCDSAMSAIAVGHAPPASFQNVLADARAAIAKATNAPAPRC